jgi:hypothetical protein
MKWYGPYLVAERFSIHDPIPAGDAPSPVIGRLIGGETTMMKNGIRTAALTVVMLSSVAVTACSDASAAATEITVYATPTCACCSGWMDHLREDGFIVNAVYQNDLTAIRQQHGLPAELTSCHLGVVEGFAVEGHVPAAVVRRLLRERPEILGIAAPGMPAGSPGMELPDGSTPPYEVFSYDETGPLGVFEFVN